MATDMSTSAPSTPPWRVPPEFFRACRTRHRVTLVPPLHEYGREDGIAVVGGYVYRGQAYPQWTGRYFFADYSGRLWSLRRDGVRVMDHAAALAAPGQPRPRITSMGEDAAGAVHPGFEDFAGVDHGAATGEALGEAAADRRGQRHLRGSVRDRS